MADGVIVKGGNGYRSAPFRVGAGRSRDWNHTEYQRGHGLIWQERAADVPVVNALTEDALLERLLRPTGDRQGAQVASDEGLAPRLQPNDSHRRVAGTLGGIASGVAVLGVGSLAGSAFAFGASAGYGLSAGVGIGFVLTAIFCIVLAVVLIRYAARN